MEVIVFVLTFALCCLLGPDKGVGCNVSVGRIGSMCSDDDTLILWFWFLIFVHLSILKTNTLFRKVGFLFFFFLSREMDGWHSDTSVQKKKSFPNHWTSDNKS